MIEDSQHTAEWTQHLFNRLALGDTLHDAITWADDWNRDGNMTEMVRVSGGGSVDAQVFGDRFRYKLHGVYGGTGTWWYK